MSAPNITIRICTELQEWEQCVQLQQEVWGFSDLDLVPLRMFSVACKIGGQVVGAVGVSGGSGKQDQSVAEAAAAAFTS